MTKVGVSYHSQKLSVLVLLYAYNIMACLSKQKSAIDGLKVSKVRHYSYEQRVSFDKEFSTQISSGLSTDARLTLKFSPERNFDGKQTISISVCLISDSKEIEFVYNIKLYSDENTNLGSKSSWMKVQLGQAVFLLKDVQVKLPRSLSKFQGNYINLKIDLFSYSQSSSFYN